MTTNRRLEAPPTWLAALLLTCCACGAAVAADPLPSWNNTPTKQAILKFVAETTKPGAPGFVPPAERIATFDNDGTLWAEQPLYAQGVFAIDRVRAMAPEHPDWKDKEPFKTILSGDLKSAMASGEQGMVALVMITHAGMTNDAFDKEVREWMATAQDPRFKRPYTELRLPAHARAAGLSARERLQDLHRVRRRRRVHARHGGEVLRHPARAGHRQHDRHEVRRSERRAGARPPAPGSSSSTTAPASPSPSSDPSGAGLSSRSATPTATRRCSNGPPPAAGARFMGLVHHTDADREWAYDRKSPVGRLDKALDEANARAGRSST